MLRNFAAFAAALAANFIEMSKSELYRVAIDGDAIWAAYLAAFPEGTNPIYRVRTEHDGSYDRHFVRRMGNVVRINSDGTLTTIWDIPGLQQPYDHVCFVLSAMVRNAALDTLFRTKESEFGYFQTFERDKVTGAITKWNHFHCKISSRHRTLKPDEVTGEFNTTVGVIKRGFTEITPEAVATVLDLIEQNTLYRGAEFKTALEGFQRSQNLYMGGGDGPLGDQYRVMIVFQAYGTAGARLRNTAIGTLLQDLSAGTELETAVRSFERMVAPTNYKRPTALVTPKMVEQAVETIRSLDLESALERRFANINDISVNNVIWADGNAASRMKDGLTSMLMAEVKHPAPADLKPTPMRIEQFLEQVLPQATSLEAFFGNDKQANLMSLLAPVHADAGSLFNWRNNFSWSYVGNITDSIKERVKAAGGNVDAMLRVSLAWFNHDDLDIHASCPDGYVYYAAKGGDSRNHILDVDMNVGGNLSRTPVENLSWTNPKDGKYKIIVDQYNKRDTADQGFTIEVANNGKVTQYNCPRNDRRRMGILEFIVRNQVIVELKVLDPSVTGQSIAQERWGLITEQFVKVDTVLNSPNHWDGERTGNKHVFFILHGARNDEAARGIYNEFLKPELAAHRKVFEVLGNKTKALPTQDQLSGLGFSTTQRDSLIVRVTNPSSTRIYEIQF